MLLNEGGSAPGVGPIHKDEMQATLAPLERAFGIDLYNNMLGSAGKKQFSGDIDVAVTVEQDDIAAFGQKVQDSPLTLFYSKTSVFITKVKQKPLKSMRRRSLILKLRYKTMIQTENL